MDARTATAALSAFGHFARAIPRHTFRREEMKHYDMVLALYRGGFSEAETDAAMRWLGRHGRTVDRWIIYGLHFGVGTAVGVAFWLATGMPVLAIYVGLAVGFLVAMAVGFVVTGAVPHDESPVRSEPETTWSGVWPREETLRKAALFDRWKREGGMSRNGGKR